MATTTVPHPRHRPLLALLGVALLLLGGPIASHPASVAAATTRHVTTCADGGAGTLREQIAAAGAGDMIVFDQDCTITLATGTLILAQDVTIDGTGHTVIVDGGCTVSSGDCQLGTGVTVFAVNSGVTASLSNLTIQHGQRGIANGGTLTVRNSTITSNSTANGFSGGGIDNASTLAVTNSTITGNSALLGGGGGILNFSGTVTVTNSTITGNQGHGRMTIHENLIGVGGILNFSGTVTVANTIVAANFGTTDSDLVGTITSGGHNLIGDTAGSSGWVTSDLLNTDPRLLPLGDYGGPTRTMDLQPDSPALDRVPATGANCPATDQRGVPRPQGSACDIGAIEHAALLSLAVAPTTATLKVGQTQAFTATGTYPGGVTADITSQVTWTSDGPAASVDASGTATGQTAGTAQVTASIGGVSGQATVTVTAGTPVGVAPVPQPAGRPGSAGGASSPAPLPSPRASGAAGAAPANDAPRPVQPLPQPRSG